LEVKPGSVELHIEELVLHSFEPGDRHRIGEAAERELSRLFTEQGTPPSLTRGHEIARVDGGTFEAKQGSTVEAVGAQVARAVYGGLS
jgi:hypothetical protein